MAIGQPRVWLKRRPRQRNEREAAERLKKERTVLYDRLKASSKEKNSKTKNDAFFDFFGLTASKKRKRLTTTSIVFSNTLFPKHLEAIESIHQMTLLLDERKAEIDKRKAERVETHAIMKRMKQQLLDQNNEIARMQQSIDKDDQQRLSEIFDIKYNGSPTSVVAGDDASWDQLLDGEL